MNSSQEQLELQVELNFLFLELKGDALLLELLIRSHAQGDSRYGQETDQICLERLCDYLAQHLWEVEHLGKRWTQGLYISPNGL